MLSLAVIFIFHLNSTGNGVVIHIPQFFDELEALEAKGNYAINLSSLVVPLILINKREPEILKDNVLNNDYK